MGEGSATGEPWGAWRSRGYGWLLNVDASGFTISDVTAISHAVVDQGAPGSFHQAFEVLERDGADGLSLRQRGDVTTYVFDRVAPAVVSRPDAADANPERNFDILWRQFHDHYAFFERRGVDWGEAYARLRPEVEAEGGSDALWDRAAELVAPLKDAHVTIAGGGRVLDVTSPIRERKLVMQRALGVPAWSLDRRAYTHGVGAAFNTLFLGGGGRLTSNGMLLYGEVAPGVGYLAVFGEFGHADTDRSRAALDLPRPRLGAAVFLADEIEGLRRGLDEVVGALSGMNALIVDVRLNYGGYDRLALDIAARFTAQPRIAYRKKTWAHGAVAMDQAISFEPAGPSLAHLPVWLLTGRQTASAGEILVLAMSACSTVTGVGEATLGILSDNLYKRLPNGWEVSLSNEIYETADGTCWEMLGVPPVVDAPVYDAGDPMRALRRTVEVALDLARVAR